MAEPALADAMRAIAEAAIEDRLVAAVLVYETPDGAVLARTIPDLNAVRVGLLTLVGSPAAFQEAEDGSQA